MSFKVFVILCVSLLLSAILTFATIFGNVRGIIHDPEHRPIKGARVTLRAQASGWTRSALSNAEGEMEFDSVPAGVYEVTVEATGFRVYQEGITVASGSAPIFHFQLEIAAIKQSVEVSAAPQAVGTESSATQIMVSRQQVVRTPGADRTNSLAMITDYLPGAYMVHDQLHVRGGHQVTWEVDGVPVPNTNIASNVGPQFDPKDLDYVELKSGSYSAEYGDRTYGVFNVIPRTGFEYNREGALVASYGNFNQMNDQLTFGSHTDRFAYFGSFNANRSDLGLMTPVPGVLHDMESGLGGFGSLILNATPDDQLRLVGSVRGDHYQIPNTPDQQAGGARDLDLERDAFVNFSWVHTFSPILMLTVSPFYHFNRAHYAGGPNDTPIVANDDRASRYLGGQATLTAVKGKHNAQIGFEGFAQNDETIFGLQETGAGRVAFEQQSKPSGSVEAVFFQDQYRPTQWLSITGGMRITHYSGLLDENAADPRAGASLRVPKLGWILHASYGRYYQPPPLNTVGGPLLQFAVKKGFGFLPLRGERDEQYQAGLTIPFRRWSLDADVFRTHARNFFDHDELGNSNIFLPLTIQGTRIQGWESTLRSPELFHLAQIHMAYSHQFVQGFGEVTGGLTDFSPPEAGFFFLDHDQRNTLSTVLALSLPRRIWATTAVSYGSGFLNGNGPAHLPAHTTLDLSLGKAIGESWSVALNAINVANHRYLLDNSNTFGGTHYADPRQVYFELRYHFGY